MFGGWVYIMTNRPNGILYTGVTSDIARRTYEHRQGLGPGFTKRSFVARDTCGDTSGYSLEGLRA